MSERLTVGVVGAGSIGCFVGARLMAADSADVVLVGRARLQKEIAAHGLTASDFDRQVVVEPDRVRYETDTAALSDCEAVLCCVKSAQTSDVGRELAKVLRPDAVVASLQNGIHNADMLRAQLGDRVVLGGIVGFNVVSRGDGVFHRGMSGPLILEASDLAKPRALIQALSKALGVETRKSLTADQWTKLLINLNNAVSALSGEPTKSLLLSPKFRRIIAAIVSEALGVLRAANISPAKLRGVPVGLLPRVLRLPTPIVRLVTSAQMRVDPTARSSMWEDLERRRTTEVDYLNGEIVKLADRVGAPAPYNQRIVELVREAERAEQGSPNIDADSLWAKLSTG